MKKLKTLVALLLVMCLLAGCGELETLRHAILSAMAPDEQTYDLMTYIHPDMDRHDELLNYACTIAKYETDPDRLLGAVYAYYDAYDLIYAAYDISYLRYCGNMTSQYWAEEYAYCEENIYAVDDGLETLYRALADSPIRSELESSYFGEGFFDSYEEDSEPEPELDALWEQESDLMLRYYDIYEEAGSEEAYTQQWYDLYEPQLGQVLVELIEVRQQIADYFGYESYPEFCYEVYHGRNYTPEQAEGYLLSIRDELTGVYSQLDDSDVWAVGREECTEEEVFDYVKSCANAMGGDFAEAFSLLEEEELYDIRYSTNKYPTSFEVYILYYYVPYVYLCPDGAVYDKLSFAHEFGHFTADYVCSGSYAGTDVSEVLSQSTEYLSLFYAEQSEQLQKLKLADSLSLYVDQAAYALFEQQMYALEGDQLTTENLQALYAQVCTEFGFDSSLWDARDYVTIPHYFEQPLYIVSYVVSNDLAMQIYQLEAEQSGAGLAVLEEAIYSEETCIIAFAETCGLESPFAPQRMEALKTTFSVLPD